MINLHTRSLGPSSTFTLGIPDPPLIRIYTSLVAYVCSTRSDTFPNTAELGDTRLLGDELSNFGDKHDEVVCSDQ